MGLFDFFKPKPNPFIEAEDAMINKRVAELCDPERLQERRRKEFEAKSIYLQSILLPFDSKLTLDDAKDLCIHMITFTGLESKTQDQVIQLLLKLEVGSRFTTMELEHALMVLDKCKVDVDNNTVDGVSVEVIKQIMEDGS